VPFIVIFILIFAVYTTHNCKCCCRTGCPRRCLGWQQEVTADFGERAQAELMLCFTANNIRAMNLEGSNGRGYGYVWKRVEIHTEFWWVNIKVTDYCKT